MKKAVIVVIALTLSLVSFNAFAHCDTMSGPVVADAKLALEKSDVTPVLKWVQAKQEAEVRDAFALAVASKEKGSDAREASERKFFETLVRLHRESEGAPFTGVKPAGTPNEPGVDLADGALASGSPDEMIRKVNAHVSEGIRSRYVRASETKKHADESVAEGREYVEAYVDYIHYVMGIAEAAHKTAGATDEHSASAHTH